MLLFLSYVVNAMHRWPLKKVLMYAVMLHDPSIIHCASNVRCVKFVSNKENMKFSKDKDKYVFFW